MSEVNKTIKFVKTNSSKLEEVINTEEFESSIIHVHDSGDSDGDDVLYIGKDRITDKLNVGDRDVDTVTNAIGGLDASTLGQLRKKTISEIIIDMLTGSEEPDVLDGGFVVDSEDDLLTIDDPYQGMIVNVKGTPVLWILVGEDASDKDNWKPVTGENEEIVQEIQRIWDELGVTESDIDSLQDDVNVIKSDLSQVDEKIDQVDEKIDNTRESLENRIDDVENSLGVLTEIVGNDDPATGIIGDLIDVNERIDDVEKKIKDGGSSFSKYSLPVMTPEMVEMAEAEDSDFDGSEDPYILIDDDLQPSKSQGDVYLEMMNCMFKTICALKAEVTKLRNSFAFGINSYQETDTIRNVEAEKLGEEEKEPTWAIEEGYLSLVPDSINFNTLLDENNSFKKVGSGTIDATDEGRLVFNNCKGIFYDGNRFEEPLTLYKLTDSKLITYLVTDKPNVKMNLVSLDDKTKERVLDFADILDKAYPGTTVQKYGFCIILSRKVKVNNDEKGSNYIYLSIINYKDDSKFVEGFLAADDTISEDKIDILERYSIKSLEFDNLTLSRMKFYTKYEDFKDGIIPVKIEDESRDIYDVAHISIRAVANTDVLNQVTPDLCENELIWNKKSGTLHIKSNGKVYLIGSNKEDDKQKDDNMTNKEIVDALKKMGIIINAQYDAEGNIVEGSLSNISMAPISDITFINEDTSKKFTFKVDTEGNLVGKDNSAQTIAEFLKDELHYDESNYDDTGYKAVRGFICDYITKKRTGKINLIDGVNKETDTGKNSDRLRVSSFYAPITTDDVHGCTHSFIELENSSPIDIPLTGIYLHFYNPTENNGQGVVHHLALDGVIKAGSTYLIRGAKHAEFDDESAFIKVKTFDKEWYENGVPISFEQKPVKTETYYNEENKKATRVAEDSEVKTAYRFCLTYGLPTLNASDVLVAIATSDRSIGGVPYKISDFPNDILNARFIDSCSYSTFIDVAKQTGDKNPWYINGKSGNGIVITKNSMFRLTFALDPAKQAFNGFNTKDSSRVRYNSTNDLQILNLDKEFIGYPFSKEIIKIDRYTPKASFENRNVMTDKSQLNREKPNMVTCSFGVDVYNTRCFNWISCGAFDEYIWVRKHGETSWTKFQSYTNVSSNTPENHTNSIYRKEYLKDVNNTVYARMINRFPGNEVLFTAHKCVLVFPDASTNPEVYEYVVGRPDKDGKPDSEHTNDVFTFTIYPRYYEGRVYQVTDQQGFHWIEYQVWAAAAEKLNTKIAEECAAINSDVNHTVKVFPILLNTGDMTQSGARINEWLDYYNGGSSLFNHLEQMNCVGNNDLCPINPNDLGTGNDSDKSSSHFFHYFYCFDVRDTDKCTAEDVSTQDKPNQFIYSGSKFFTGESLVVKAHSGSVVEGTTTTNINITTDKYIPSLYYFKTRGVLYVIVNSEIPISNCQQWFGLCSDNHNYVNVYTGIEAISSGNYVGGQLSSYDGYFTPIYETIYAWLDSNRDVNSGEPIKKVIVAMHEMPFTVITRASLKNNDATTIPCTRNHPTNGNRLGSNVNQLSKAENRGIYWCSRLLEWFNCKLVIGGHKHTYALSYPIKEKYNWTYTGTEEFEDITKGYPYDSKDKIKPMFETLSDEAGVTPKFNVSWDIVLTSDETRDEYGITKTRTGDGSVSDAVKLNSTKTPYIPKHLYNNYGSSISSANDFRCCTPLDLIDESEPTAEYDGKYDGFVTYSMCQATGYKLKSNKELPSKTQVFSKIIPETTYDGDSDKPNANQLYPMYSVLEFSDDYSELDVTMNRITGIFKTDGADKFNQIEYGSNKSKVTIHRLCTYEKEDCDSYGPYANRPENPKNGYLYFATDADQNKVYKYTITDGVGTWAEEKQRMYGRWLTEQDAKNRLDAYKLNPSTVSDNRYLHIKF